MSSTFTKVAAVAASTALIVSGAQAAEAAEAQTGAGATGGVNLGSVQLGGTAGAGSEGSTLGGGATVTPPTPGTPATPADTGSMNSGSLKAYGQNPVTGSLRKNANATGTGVIDTSGSALIGEPTFGSLASGVQNALGSNVSSPARGAGSVDTSGSLGEPTTGSLAPLTATIAGSLGTDTGITAVLTQGSLAAGSSVLGGANTGSLGVLLPLVLVGGSVAAGIAAAPAIQDAINNLMPKAPAQTPPPAQGPAVDNGRG